MLGNCFFGPNLCRSCTCQFFTGRMASGVRNLDFLTRRHGVKIVSKASVEDCSLAVGEVVGCENVVSASRMNNAIVVFLKTTELANIVVESGVVVDNAFVPVLPLSLPSKKVILSNVPPFIKNDVLAPVLERYGKLVSPIKMIQIGCKSPLLKHVVSFRRFVYMVLNESREDLDLTFNLKHDEFNYVIFATTNNMKCLSCGELGHLVRACPRKDDKSKQNAVPVLAEKTGVIEGETVRMELPSVSDAVEENSANTSKNVNPAVASGDTAASKQMDSEGTAVVAMEEALVTNKIQSSNGLGDMQSSDKSQDMELEGDQDLKEQDECVFKTPQKRRMKQRHYSKLKKGENVNPSQTDTESETDLSECSVSFDLSQDDSLNQSYTVDDIKIFLRKTKSARNVRISKYFPDLAQFAEKARFFKSEGLFSDQEVFRLKKILTKVSSQLGINVDEDKK